MKKLILIVLVCLIPPMAQAHPGKTDKYGGHKCLKYCEDWDLSYAEYHLHDKDGKPIRVAKRPKKQEQPVVSDVAPVAETASAPVISTVTRTVTITEYRHVIDETILPNPYLFILLILLLLLLILRLARKRSKD